MTLIRLGFVDEETLIRTLASQLKLPVARIRGKRVGSELLECIGCRARREATLPATLLQTGAGRARSSRPPPSRSLSTMTAQLAREPGEERGAAWALRLPVVWLFAFALGGGVVGAWYAEFVFIAVLAAALVQRFRSGAWAGVRI